MANYTTTWAAIILDWSYGGADLSGPHADGGPTCRDHVTMTHRSTETMFGIAVGILSLGVGCWMRREVKAFTHPTSRKYNVGRVVLLVSMSIVYGTQLGYKLSTRKLIFLIYPCHLLTLIQIYLLATPMSILPSFNSTLFKLATFFIMGPIQAMICPSYETLQLPFEVQIYFIQHYLIIITGIYMVVIDNGYTPHETSERFPWTLIAYGTWSLYHWTFMQAMSYITTANIGLMLCASPSDPLDGPYYRLLGIIHQFIFIFIMGYLIDYLQSFRQSKKNPPKPIESNPQIMNGRKMSQENVTPQRPQFGGKKDHQT